MINLKKLILDKRGDGAVLAVVMAMALMIIFAGVSEFFRVYMIVQGIEDGVQKAVTSVSTNNYTNIYSGVRDGYAGGYELSSTEQWETLVDEGSVLLQLDELLGLYFADGYHIKKQGEGFEYRISDLQVDIINVPFAPGNGNSQRFESIAYIDLELPLSFGFEMIPPLVLTLKVHAGYNMKF